VSTPHESNSGFDIEQFLNLIFQRLFPRWYARQAAKEIQLPELGDINPGSFLSHRWLSLLSTHEAIAESLRSASPEWQPLCDQLTALLTETEYKRNLSITAIHGIQNSQCDDELPDLMSYAQQQCEDIPHETPEDFDQNIHQAFPDAERPFHVCYREWDGRYYLMNKEEPRYFGALRLQCASKHRDFNLPCIIHVEAVHNRTLDRIRAGYWLLLLKRESAYQLFQLMKNAKLPCEIAEFEWRRSDLVFFIARKNNPTINQVLLTLLGNHNSKQVIDWGRFLSRSRFPFHNK
jgi:hypothetical protein